MKIWIFWFLLKKSTKTDNTQAFMVTWQKSRWSRVAAEWQSTHQPLGPSAPTGRAPESSKLSELLQKR